VSDVDAHERSGRWRTPVARLLTVVGVLLVLVSIAANYVERQALDSDEFEATARELIDDAVIQQRLATSLTDELFAQVDVQAELEQALPADQKALAGVIAGAMRPLAERLAAKILDRPRFQEVWVAALTGTQKQVVRVLDDETRFLQTEGGVVVIDLRQLLRELAVQLPLATGLADRLPPDAGVIQLFEAEQVETAQTVTRILRFVADWIWVLALAAWVGAVFLTRDRRREVRAIALGFVVVGLLLLVARRGAGRYLVDQLAPPGSDGQGIQNVWDILTALLADAAWAAIGVGLIAVAGVWVAGPSTRGTAVRRWLAPYLRRPEIAYGAAAAAYLLLLLWGPISYVRKPSMILLFAVLGAVGIELLRRQTAREVPDAAPGDPLGALGAQARRLRGPGSGGGDRSLELERLARLHQAGELTDEEYADAKSKTLGS
jgi:hypothetical protein